jgi:hypothetical protein
MAGSNMEEEAYVSGDSLNMQIPMGAEEVKRVDEAMATIVRDVKKAAEDRDWFKGMRDALRNLKIIQGLKHKLSRKTRAELIEILYRVATTTPDLDETLLKSIGQVEPPILCSHFLCPICGQHPSMFRTPSPSLPLSFEFHAPWCLSAISRTCFPSFFLSSLFCPPLQKGLVIESCCS